MFFDPAALTTIGARVAKVAEVAEVAGRQSARSGNRVDSADSKELQNRAAVIRDSYVSGFATAATFATSATLAELSAHDREAIEEAIEERAAIREFDGGQTRDVAEREARAAMRVYRYRLADSPDTWLVMIAPGCNLAEAWGALNLQFGPHRVLVLVEHTPRRAAN